MHVVEYEYVIPADLVELLEIINKTVDSATRHMTFSIFYRYIKTLCRFYALIFSGTESRKMVITGTLKVLN